ncbi:MAG: M23 family metallopeptidase [Candidatus Omnitrophota bacterium]
MIKHILVLIFFILVLSGCKTTTHQIKTVSLPQAKTTKIHRVQKGETLWKISKLYNIDLHELVNINHISDSSNIEIEQTLLIPESPEQKYLFTGKTTSEDFIWPLKGKVVSSFGQTINNIKNNGVNISACGNSDIIASRSGKVVFCNSNLNGFGKTIIIEHHGGFLTLYSRNSEILVKTGDIVQRGMAIAKVGQAGRDHLEYLHFEIRKGHRPQNPKFYLP